MPDCCLRGIVMACHSDVLCSGQDFGITEIFTLAPNQSNLENHVGLCVSRLDSFFKSFM